MFCYFTHDIPYSQEEHDKSVGASISNDFTDGHRGMAKAVRGAKKFVRSRIRFSENAATKKLAEQDLQDVFSNDSL